MSIQLRILQLEDLESLLEFEQKKGKEIFLDEMEQMFAKWNSKARKESLEYYLPLGWSFVAIDTELDLSQKNGSIVGYFLGQALLFIDGQTQSLWIEHLQYSSLQARDELCELAYKLGREKHLQKVYFPQGVVLNSSVQIFKPEVWNPQILAVKTTKVN